ncbi:MAG: hypothetical protein ACOX5W_07190 [Bacillota bacterium]
MKGKNNILLLTILFVLLVGIFYSSTEPNMQELIIFTLLSALMMFAFFLTNRYYITDKSSLKQRIIFICMVFITITIFYVTAKELTGFSLEYVPIVLFLVALIISTLWESLDLTMLEKGVLALTLISVLGVTAYQSISSKPSTAIQLYRSELREGTNFENIQELFFEDYRDDFTLEEFQNVEPYLQQHPLRFNQPALLEFEDGQMLMIEVGVSQEPNNPLRIKNIELLPERIASYFRYYPLEIERKADFPRGKEEDESIIETRGAFISRASFRQERDWYEQLIGVFGKKEVRDELWEELEGISAPEGPVRGSGTSSEGYLEFRFDNDWEVNKEILDKLYNAFQDKASEQGITDLPVVFRWY